MKKEFKDSFKIVIILYCTCYGRMFVFAKRMPIMLMETVKKKLKDSGNEIIDAQSYDDIKTSPGFALRKYSQQWRMKAKSMEKNKNVPILPLNNTARSIPSRELFKPPKHAYA